MPRRKISVFFVILTILLNLLPLNIASANEVQAVELNYSNNNTAHPLITGETQKGTEVLIYDNLKYIGLAEEIKQNETTVNFSFIPDTPLGEGEHVIKALVRDKTSLILSVFSNEIIVDNTQEVEEEVVVLGINNESKGSVPAPTLIEPNENTITAKVMPLIKGLTVDNTKVNIYIDGVLNGGTELLNHESGTANFAYKPFLNLSIGKHTAWAVTVDEAGNTSLPSNVLSFSIEEQYPAPTLLEVTSVAGGKMQVTGLAKNDSKIRVYVDHALKKEMMLDSDPSGTGNFAVHLDNVSSNHSHVVYTTAVDTRGKESKWSNIFFTKSTSVSKISDEAVEEEVEVLSLDNSDFEELKELLVQARLLSEGKDVKISIQDKKKAENIINKRKEYSLSLEEVKSLENLLKSKDDSKNIDDEIDEILNTEEDDKKGKTGTINESKENQGKLQFNLVIFIFFLAAVIVWIFWVNRELIKERREQNEKEEKFKKSKK